jgi:hypothetical protein
VTDPKPLTRQEIHLLMGLRWTDESREYPGPAAMARFLRLSRATVLSCREALIERGLIHWISHVPHTRPRRTLLMLSYRGTQVVTHASLRGLFFAHGSTLGCGHPGCKRPAQWDCHRCGYARCNAHGHYLCPGCALAVEARLRAEWERPLGLALAPEAQH